jgi:hypothetical protein
MGNLSSTGTFTQETAKLRATLLQTKQYNNNFQASTQVLLVFLAVYAVQKKLHVFMFPSYRLQCQLKLTATFCEGLTF